MKAYPLIYSRTKNFDFVPDFLVRPKDLNYQMALQYVKNAINNLDFIQNIRYTAFPVDKYCVCGGISCISKRLVDKLEVVSPEFSARYPDANEYLSDCKGRNIAFFIGIAIPRTEMKDGIIPDISLEEYWDIYLQYLKHQWDSESNTVSEKLELPPLDIKEKQYVELLLPQKERLGEHNIIRNYERNEQQILDYFFHAILNGNSDSFITEIQNREEWNALNFSSVVVSDSLYLTIKANPISVSKSNSSLHGSNSVKTQRNGEVEIKRMPTPELGAGTYTESKKKASPHSIMSIIVFVTMCLGLLCLGLLRLVGWIISMILGKII